MKHGLLLVDKHSGCTSHDIVQQVRRLLRQRKVGHCGTLDPSATGLLIMTVGNATRLTRFLIRAPKVYSGTIRFGVSTDTYDAQGEVTEERSTEGLTRERVAEAMSPFEGVIQQRAPSYSAKKVKGKKLYELARRGEEVPEEIKEVTVFEFSPQSPLTDDQIDFRLGCSSGTYARALAHDLGEALGCGGHLSRLRRLQVGSFKIDQAASLETLEERSRDERFQEDPEHIDFLGDAWVPFDRVELPFEALEIDLQQEQRIRQGQTILVRDLSSGEGDWLKLANPRGQFVAVGTVVERIGDRGVGIIQPRVVFR